MNIRGNLEAEALLLIMHNLKNRHIPLTTNHASHNISKKKQTFLKILAL